MTTYTKKLRSKTLQGNLFAIILFLGLSILLLAALFLRTFPQDSTLYEDYDDFKSHSARAFNLRLDVNDYFDYLVEERTLSDHYVLFMMQEDEQTFNVILSESKTEQLFTDGFLTVTVYKMTGDGAEGYRDSILDYLNTQGLDSTTLDFYRNLARSDYYTTPFNQTSNIILLAGGLFLAVLGLFYLFKGIVAMRGGGQYQRDLEFIAGQMGGSTEQVEDTVNTSLNDSLHPAYVTRSLVCNKDWIMARGNSGPRLMRTSDVVWAYRHTIQQRTYGIKTGSSHFVILYAQNSAENCMVPFKNAKEADLAFAELQTICTRAYLGFSDELAAQAKKKNYPALLAAWNAQQNQPYQSATSQPLYDGDDYGANRGEDPNGPYRS